MKILSHTDIAPIRIKTIVSKKSPLLLRMKLKRKKNNTTSPFKALQTTNASLIMHSTLSLLRKALRRHRLNIQPVSTSIISARKKTYNNNINVNVAIQDDEIKCILDRITSMKRTHYTFSTEVSDKKGRLVAIIDNTISISI